MMGSELSSPSVLEKIASAAAVEPAEVVSSVMTFGEVLCTSIKENPDAVFDFKAILNSPKGSVDDIKMAIDRLEAEADVIKDKWVKLFKRHAEALENQVKGLKDFIKIEMLKSEWDELYGDMWKMKLQRTQASLEIPFEPTLDDWEKYPTLVRSKHILEWDKEAVKKFINEGGRLPGATMKENKTVRFYVK